MAFIAAANVIIL